MRTELSKTIPIVVPQILTALPKTLIGVNTMSKKVSEEDLLGTKKYKAKRLKASLGTFDNGEKRPILEVEILDEPHVGLKHRYGIITDSIKDKILKSAEKDESGDIIIMVTEPQLDKSITWINMY